MKLSWSSLKLVALCAGIVLALAAQSDANPKVRPSNPMQVACVGVQIDPPQG